MAPFPYARLPLAFTCLVFTIHLHLELHPNAYARVNCDASINADTNMNTYNNVCTPLSSVSVCAPVLPQQYQTSVPNITGCSVSSSLSSSELLVVNAPYVWAVLDTKCQSALATLQCMVAFPPCGSLLCPSICSQVMNQCSSFTELVTRVFDFSLCSKLPLFDSNTSTTCFNSPYSSPSPSPTTPAVVPSSSVSVPPSTPSPPPPSSSSSSSPSSASPSPSPSPSPSSALDLSSVLPSCVPYTGSECANVIDYDVMMPPGTSMQFNEYLLHQFSFVYNVVPLAFSSCNNDLNAFLCAQFYTRCDRQTVQKQWNISISVPVPRPLCYGDCALYSSSCGFFLEGALAQFNNTPLQPFLYRSCNASSTSDLTSSSSSSSTSCSLSSSLLHRQSSSSASFTPSISPLFPLSSEPDLLDLSAMNPAASASASSASSSVAAPLVSVTCQSFVDPLTQTMNVQANVHCPWPLIRTSDPQIGLLEGSCAVPCMDYTVYTVDEWNNGELIMNILTPCSFLCSLILFFTHVIFPSKRKQTFVLHFALSVLLLSLSQMLTYTYTDFLAVGCANPYTVHKQGDVSASARFCVYQGITVYGCALTASCFWALIAVELWLKIVFNLKMTTRASFLFKTGGIAYGWGMALLSTIIGLAADVYGGEAQVPWCGITPTAAPWFEWVGFYGPISVNCLVGFSCMARCIIELILSARRTKSASMKNWHRHIRPLVFLVQFMFLFVFVCGFRFQNKIDETAQTNSAVEYVTCLLKGGTQATCGLHQALRPQVGLWYLIIVSFSGFGVINFATHGVQLNNWYLWLGLVTCRGLNGDFQRESTHTKESKNNNTLKGGTGGSVGTSSPVASHHKDRLSSRGSHLQLGVTGLGNGNARTLSLSPNSPISPSAQSSCRPIVKIHSIED